MAGVAAALAACGDAKHEPVRVIAQPRAVVPAAPEPMPVAAPPAAPAPAASVPVPPTPPAPRGLDAAPPPGLASAGPPQRRWQPGEPNGNADFRKALESRQGARGQAVQP